MPRTRLHRARRWVAPAPAPVKKKRQGRKLPNFMPDDAPEALLRATTRERDRMLLLVALYFGLRNSEICKLQVEHIDFKRRVLTVREGKGKRDRACPIPSKMFGPLRAWVGGRLEGYVFPSPRGGRLSTRAVQLLVKRMALKAGLHGATEPRRYRPHGFRHAYASRLLNTGANIREVQELLGHSSLNSTMQYVHADPKRLVAAVDRL